MQLLLGHPSAQVNYRSGKRLRTALTTAVIKGDEAKTKKLLESGADYKIADADGRMPAHFAAADARLGVLKILKNHGADLRSPAPGERTLLHLAAYDTEAFAKENDRVETFKWLLGQKLDFDAADNSGLTPLMIAAYNARKEVVRLLIDAGADLDATDSEGRTPLFHAVCGGTEYGWNDRYVRPRNKSSDRAAPIITALLEAGADPNKRRVLNEASRWRWPGAKKLLKSFGAVEQ